MYFPTSNYSCQASDIPVAGTIFNVSSYDAALGQDSNSFPLQDDEQMREVLSYGRRLCIEQDMRVTNQGEDIGLFNKLSPKVL